MSKDYRSNTMELDSILEEARNRKNGTAAAKSASRTASAPKPVSRPQQNAKAAQARRSFNDDFVLTDDDKQPASAYAVYNDQDYDDYEERPRKSKTGLIVALCIVGVILLAGIGGLVMYLNSGSQPGPSGTFSDNVYVNGKSLKGLTLDEARALMAPVEKELADQIKTTVKAGDKSFDLTKNDFKVSFNTEDVLAQAKKYSEEKGIKTSQQNYEIKMSVDESSCKNAVNKIAGEVSSEAKDATVTKFDPDASDMFTIEAEQKGVKLEEDKTVTALSTLIKQGTYTGTVDAPTTQVDPKVTKDFLAGNIVELSHFSTTSYNNSNGNENMRISLAACKVMFCLPIMMSFDKTAE